MNQYRVTWEIDVDAETPEDAAHKALVIQRDPESIATVFTIEGEYEHIGEWIVDLDANGSATVTETRKPPEEEV